MTLTEFKSTLSGNQPPPGMSPLLAALWYEAKGDWEKAHNIAQDVQHSEGSWVHAYLHRKEGDRGNAGYWYARAGKPFPKTTLEAEWAEIADSLLKSRGSFTHHDNPL